MCIPRQTSTRDRSSLYAATSFKLPTITKVVNNDNVARNRNVDSGSKDKGCKQQQMLKTTTKVENNDKGCKQRQGCKNAAKKAATTKVANNDEVASVRQRERASLQSNVEAWRATSPLRRNVAENLRVRSYNTPQAVAFILRLAQFIVPPKCPFQSGISGGIYKIAPLLWRPLLIPQEQTLQRPTHRSRPDASLPHYTKLPNRAKRCSATKT
jgi:hypothetical protein